MFLLSSKEEETQRCMSGISLIGNKESQKQYMVE